jgi:hypothetical protein
VQLQLASLLLLLLACTLSPLRSLTCLCMLPSAVQVLDPGGRRVSPQLALFEELVVRAYLAVSGC